MSKFGDESDTYDLEYLGLTRAGNAYMVDDGDGNTVFLPTSRVEPVGALVVNKTCKFDIPNWLAEREGLC